MYKGPSAIHMFYFGKQQLGSGSSSVQFAWSLGSSQILARKVISESNSERNGAGILKSVFLKQEFWAGF